MGILFSCQLGRWLHGNHICMTGRSGMAGIASAGLIHVYLHGVDICIFEYGIYFAYLQQAYLHTYAVFA
jgi:hypothetical protein